MPLSKAQRMIANSPARFRVVCAGRRFGKSYTAIREMAKFARYPDQLVFYVAPSYRQAKQIIWKKLKQRLTAINWVHKINETELSLELINGSVICLKGAENYDSLRGVGINFLVIDEMADIAQEAWTEVLRPALSDTQGHALFLSTPKGYNFFKELYDNAKIKSGWQAFQFTTLDGGNVPPEEVEQARQDLDARTFRQEYLATFEQYAGVIAYAFGDHNIQPVAKPIDDKESVIIGCDFNHSPLCAAVFRQTPQGLECYDEIAIYNSNTNELAEEIRNRYPRNPITIYPDPAGVQRRTSANGQTDIKILQNAGFKVLYRHQHPLVKDRINSANSIFKQREELKFKIDPRCATIIKCLKHYSYKENTQIPDKDSGYDHFFDALTYPIEYIYPIKKNTQPIPAQSFGVR